MHEFGYAPGNAPGYAPGYAPVHEFGYARGLVGPWLRWQHNKENTINTSCAVNGSSPPRGAGGRDHVRRDQGRHQRCEAQAGREEPGQQGRACGWVRRLRRLVRMRRSGRVRALGCGCDAPEPLHPCTR